MKRTISSLIVLIMAFLLVGCSGKSVESEVENNKQSSAKPLVIEECQKSQIEKAINQEVRRILGGDVTLTVYSDNDTVESFSYKGRLEVVDDGTDGSDVILFIHADTRTSSDDWF